MADSELPVARVVDRDAQPDVGRTARGFGYGLLGAVFTMWGLLTASVALTIVISLADQQRKPEWFGAGALLVLAVVGYILVHRIVSPRMMSATLNRGTTLRYVSTSSVHAGFDLLWAALGAALLSVSEGWQPGPDHDLAFAMGLGFTIVPGTLFVLRVIFVSRARRALR
ncbi:MAG: hypothetical protein JNL83_38535 [Myxococcales bacterium]|nr:hypothetical protein [Myxococcales bacterium]